MHLHILQPRRTFEDGPFPPYLRRKLIFEFGAPLGVVFSIALLAMVYWLLIGQHLWKRQQVKDARDYKLGLEEAAMRIRQSIVAQEALTLRSQDDTISLAQHHYPIHGSVSSCTLLAQPIPFNRNSHAYPPTPQFEAKDPSASISSGSCSQETPHGTSRVTSFGALSQRSSAELLRDSLTRSDALLPSLSGTAAAAATRSNRRVRPIYGSEFADVRMTMSWKGRQPSLDQPVRLSVAAPSCQYPSVVSSNSLQVDHGRRPSISSVRSHGTTNADRKSIVSSVRGGVRDSSSFVKQPAIRSSLRGAPNVASSLNAASRNDHLAPGSSSLGRSLSSRSRGSRVSQLKLPPDAFKSPSAVSLPLSKVPSEASHEASQPRHFHIPPMPVAAIRPGMLQRAGSESEVYDALPLGVSANRYGPSLALSRAPSSSSGSNDTVLSNRFALSDSTTNLTGYDGASSAHVRSHPLEPHRPMAPGTAI